MTWMTLNADQPGNRKYFSKGIIPDPEMINTLKNITSFDLDKVTGTNRKSPW